MKKYIFALLVSIYTLESLESPKTLGPSVLQDDYLQNPPKYYQSSQPNHQPKYYQPSSSSGYLGTTIGLLSGGLLVSIIGLYLMPESVTNWDRSRFGFGAWAQDVQVGPVLDRDNFILNGISHPYFGAVYYLSLIHI